MNYVEARSRLVNWLRGQLMGPAGEGHLTESPLVRYPTGVLYPVEPGGAGTDPASRVYGGDEEANLLDDVEEAVAEAGEADERSRAQPVRRRRYVPPSSVGFSFCIEGAARLLITASGARYEVGAQRDERGQYLPQTYERRNLDGWSVTWKKHGKSAWDIWDGRAGIDVRARAHAAGTIFTVTLFNRAIVDPRKRGKGATFERVENSLFEAQIECAVEDGHLVEYPRVDPSLLTEEERELELQYRDRRIYAVGHGAAVEWTIGQGIGTRIRSEFMPATEVPTVTVASRGDHQAALSMRGLAEALPLDALERFVAGYGDWIALRGNEALGYRDGLERATALRMCGRMQVAQRRMQEGLKLLRSEPLVARSFRMANRAMLEQMCQSQRVKGRRADPDEFHWRPFQLAFLLTALRSTLLEEDGDRDVLDLIWFPTGGGKTEAYLGLIAVLIVWRRLKYGSEGAGTVALMRYTLRLLTRQQFERAAGVVFALELMRRKRPELLGEESIEVGIWVGGTISPNGFDEALEAVQEIGAGKSGARQKLLVERCLWCGAELDIERGSYRATDRSFALHCPDKDCEFGGDGRALPCNVVDEALYEQPPSLLIGTIDKFARLAWEARAGAFFGAGSASRKRVRAPELVIQDELHLVTGALGSVAGLYEAGLDTLLTYRGVRAKYVASTATIRMAKQQVERLYARQLAVFPPPGLSCDDSWFARTDRDRPGRLYVGYLAPLLDQSHCLAPLAAVLLGAPEAIFGTEADRDLLLDAWWTQVVYHGTLKSVGSSHNSFMTDVRAFGRRLHGESAERARGAGEADAGNLLQAEGGVSERFAKGRIEQLTSLRTAQENARTFQALTRRRGEDGSVDVVLATNMVSVGLDVGRLALMVVNGQPLTTAEYIQASSRVGRAEVPGLVVANYYRHQARSLSHYESFRPYHESFYRFVEPTSVTPYTFQVRSRALHAALVIAVRHAGTRLWNNDSAGRFDPEAAEVRSVVAELKRRCALAAGEEPTGQTGRHIDSLVAEWREEAQRCRLERRQLNYQAWDRERNAERLLRGHDETRRGLWRTLHSMRNVESSGMFRIDG